MTLTAEIKAIERRIGALLRAYTPGTDPTPCRARVAALKADRADLKRLRDDPTPALLEAEEEITGFAQALDRLGDVVAAVTERG